MSDIDAIDWQPAATLASIHRRAQLLECIRRFFAHRGVLEVDTPALSSATTVEPHLQAMTTRCSVYKGGERLYPHTSPEFPMKRLLAAGSGAIYQICKVFRDGESGRHHNPEFTMLEWYRPGYDHIRLMDEMEELLASAVEASVPRAIRITYRQAFLDCAGVDPYAGADQLHDYIAGEGIDCAGDPNCDTIDYWRDLILTHRVEPNLDPAVPTFIYDYPASQASLARIRPGDPLVAERFELYWKGLELANGFHELGDADEQAQRFTADSVVRDSLGLEPVATDQRLLAALRAGLPPCAGVALGLDRLLMAVTGVQQIDQVLAFPVDRA